MNQRYLHNKTPLINADIRGLSKKMSVNQRYLHNKTHFQM